MAYGSEQWQEIDFLGQARLGPLELHPETELLYTSSR
jgi:hypothetical protein